MKGDFSRSTFHPEKHFTGVRMQQGRVLLDAEWNEQVDIQNVHDEIEVIDIVGQSGASRITGGFALVVVTGDFIITPGRMWVDGILAENDAPEWLAAMITGTPTNLEVSAWPIDDRRYAAGLWIEIAARDNNGAVTANAYRRIKSVDPNSSLIVLTESIALVGANSIRPVYSYATQPHDPAPANLAPDGNNFPAVTLQADFVTYLDVWTRHITAVEDNSIREVALGGPDTTTRTQTIWQVRIDTNIKDCADVVSPAHKSKLLAKTAPVGTSPDPCIVPAQAGYRGLANQLYRVEVHKGSADAGGPTFKWSRDNGAFVFPVDGAVPTQATQLRLGFLGRDDYFGLKANDWVELIDDTLELHGKAGFIARVAQTPQQHNRILILDSTTLPPGTDFNDPTKSRIDLSRGPRVRLWSYDETQMNAVGETQLVPNTDLPLEAGIIVVFSGSAFESGEYWQIPARTAINEETGKLEWPVNGAGDPIPQPPRGIDHHFAALADATWDVAQAKFKIEDCRHLFSPLTAPEFFYLSGDGQEVMPILAQTLTPLPFPLKVGVENGGPIANAKVKFEIVGPGSGQVNGAASVTVNTDAQGVATVNWSVDKVNPHQLCRATLVQANGFSGTLPPIEFNASLSIASQVSYQPGACADLANAKTVQEALDILCLRGGGGGVCSIVADPADPAWSNPIAMLGPGDDAEICFKIGEFKLDSSLTIDARRVKLTGGGVGSRIRCDKGPVVFNFVGCEEVIIRDLFFQGLVNFQNTQPLGVLTFNNCTRVIVEAVEVRTQFETGSNVACILVIDQQAPISTRVLIRACTISTTNNLAGIIISTARSARIENNAISGLTVQVPPTPEALHGILLGQQAVEVQVLGNEIFGAKHAIFATEEVTGGGNQRILEISRNQVVLLVPAVEVQQGIEVVSARRLLVENNMIVAGGNLELHPKGIRVEGGFGNMIGVQANHLIGCDLVVKPAGATTHQWFATDNLVEGVGNIDIAPSVRTSPPNVKV